MQFSLTEKTSLSGVLRTGIICCPSSDPCQGRKAGVQKEWKKPDEKRTAAANLCIQPSFSCTAHGLTSRRELVTMNSCAAFRQPVARRPQSLKGVSALMWDTHGPQSLRDTPQARRASFHEQVSPVHHHCHLSLHASPLPSPHMSLPLVPAALS